MEEIKRGKAWKFGHGLDADKDIYLFKYVMEAMTKGMTKDLAKHVLEPVNPEFGAKVSKGDFVVAGKNFGVGKDHKEPASALRALGVAALIADSVNWNFFRHCVSYGLPVLTGEGVSEKIRQGDELEVNLLTGKIRNLSTGKVFEAHVEVPPGHALFPILEAGGRVPYIKKKIASQKKP